MDWLYCVSSPEDLWDLSQPQHDFQDGIDDICKKCAPHFLRFPVFIWALGVRFVAVLDFLLRFCEGLEVRNVIEMIDDLPEIQGNDRESRSASPSHHE